MSWLDEVQDKDNKAVRVSLVASAGSIGGGTEYTEGDVDASITGMAILWEDVGNTLRTVAAATPLPVTVISGGSAGVQYTEGDTDASITGTAILWEDTGDTLRAVSAAKPLPVSAGAEKTEDVAHASGAVGSFLLGVRNDLFTTTFSDANGDYTPVGVSASGQLSTVSEKQHDTPTGANDFGVQAMGVRNDGAATSLTTSNLRHSEFAVDVKGRVFTDGSTVTQPVSGTVTADTELPAAAALADDMANPTTPLIGVCAMEFDGSAEANWDRVRHSYYQALTGLSGAAGPQAQVDMSECPMGDFTVQEFKTGTVSAYNFTLEGSNDGGANWFTILNNTSASGADSTVSTTATNRRSARRFRINVASITGAGSISIHTLACPG